MTYGQIAALRARLEWTQAQMAEAIGLSWRQYTDLENGKVPLRKMHELAIERVALSEAARRRDQNILFPNVRAEVAIVTCATEG